MHIFLNCATFEVRIDIVSISAKTHRIIRVLIILLIQRINILFEE